MSGEDTTSDKDAALAPLHKPPYSEKDEIWHDPPKEIKHIETFPGRMYSRHISRHRMNSSRSLHRWTGKRKSSQELSFYGTPRVYMSGRISEGKPLSMFGEDFSSPSRSVHRSATILDCDQNTPELLYMMGELAYEQEKSDHLLSLVEELEHQQTKLHRELIHCRCTLDRFVRSLSFNVQNTPPHNSADPSMSSTFSSPRHEERLKKKKKELDLAQEKIQALNAQVIDYQEKIKTLTTVNQQYSTFLHEFHPDLVEPFEEWCTSQSFRFSSQSRKKGFLYQRGIEVYNALSRLQKKKNNKASTHKKLENTMR